MGHKDITSKYILKHIVTDMARYLFDMKLDKAELLETETQRIEDRQADLVVKASQGNKDFILHIEIQNDNQSKMPIRMLRYFTDIALSWPGYQVVQYLIYIGKQPLTMSSGIERENHSYQYNIVDMHQIDCSVFLHQDNPEAVVLAILCDFQEQDKRQIVREILNRIQQLTNDNEAQYRDCLLMLEILSKNRDLSDIIKEEERMLSTIKLEDLPSYEIGIEKGLEKGLEEGLEKGIKTGIADILLHQLISKFGSVSDENKNQIESADNELLLKWSDQILTASSIEEVFQ